MSYQQEKRVRQLLTRLAGHIKEQLPPKKAELLIEYSKQYFSTVAYEDLAERSIDDLYGAVLSHFDLMFQREQNEIKVHAFNPSQEEHGWNSSHTVIEIAVDDAPFLVDSVRMEINRRGFLIHFIIHMGGMKVRRSANHRIQEILAKDYHGKDSLIDAPIYLEVDRQTDPDVLKSLEESLTRVLNDVQMAVGDWHTMLEHLDQSLMELEQNPPPLDPAEVTESKAFLRWLKENFIFFGCRDYCLVEENGKKALEAVPGLGVGVLREHTENHQRHLSEMPPEARKLALSPHILIIAKTNTRSTIHRAAYTDYIGVKRFDKAGNIIGERRFIGLYTSSAYNSNPKHIPFLRLKVAKVLQQSGLSPHGHAGKNLLNILETLPRDDLFQAVADELLHLSMGIFHLQDRQRTKLFMRKDSYGRFYSCLVYLPRESFNTALVHQMRDILGEALSATEVTFTTTFSESVLARVHFMIRVKKGAELDVDPAVLEAKLVEVSRSWVGDLHTALVEHFGEANGVVLFNKYRQAFSASFREAYNPRTAVYDIEHIEQLSDDKPLGMHFYRPPGEDGAAFCFKVYQRCSTIPLSDALPILENMGFRVIGEQPHEVRLPGGLSVWINDFNMVLKVDKAFDVPRVRNNFQRAFAAVWLDRAENDAFNNLVINANMNWRTVNLFRAYARYFRQAGTSFSQDYLARTMMLNADITEMLGQYFDLRFNPELKRNEDALERLEKRILEALEGVSNLDEDRILRRYLAAIKATLRTNFFQKNAEGRFLSYICFKFDPSIMPDLPRPLPMFEIFVFSTRFEGVHLRGGRVARGGLRWSDRQEDFRTEVLGLMKAQKVKNAQIVPEGAKGGFVAKKLPMNGTRDEIQREGVACYRLFIRALLDLTDNLVDQKVVHPKGVVRYDEDDTYLVVAADKGTATFSDIANEISVAHGFWLGDAFASGGATGYDHKKMGITARGAWESVKRHFREMGMDCQHEDFTAVGIGDMAGDVFGNGMLCSKHTRLIAAFNHMHIFLDPNPDAATSYEERKRLFNLPRSSWEDYNAELISKGGGVFNRAAKVIHLSDEIKEALDIRKDSMVPNELIQAILKAPVDLLWNGGIGTYVKASHEAHVDVGDRANDGLRINAASLRCKVVAEGGNLGFTQAARVEYALNDGRIYTDFIDNSAGVDCSDHEVNIKILLNQVVAAGDMSMEQRNELLASMTKEVGELVLKDNYMQTLAISYAMNRVRTNFDLYSRYLSGLVHSKKIDLALEGLPDSKALSRRQAEGKSFVAPELAVLLSYCKTLLKAEILGSKLPEDDYLSQILEAEFPAILRERCGDHMKQHSLRREIIATQLVNTVVNEMGVTFVNRLREETGSSVSQVVRAFTVALVVFDKPSMMDEIFKLDLKVTTQVQFILMQKLNQLVRRATRWLLRNRRGIMDIKAMTEQFAEPVQVLSGNLTKFLPQKDRDLLKKRIDKLIDSGVPKSVAHKFATCTYQFAALDIVEAAKACKQPLEDVARMYFEVGNVFDLNWFRDRLLEYETNNQWQALARSAFRDELDTYQRMLAVNIIRKMPSDDMKAEDVIALWVEANSRVAKRWQYRIEAMRAANVVEPVMFSVCLRDLFDLAQSNRRITLSKVE
ncbi:MAG: NAD-glutamate dehydrogenase [Gammaproteobacteria bacterium CG11_big_fil_rev_8_21_14_0_20_46_22]|nr:MAG: NAD-glutamate dehydrogenase [Gammaproteobacteria bacterium CG12_big_fil_rev_8_21_14_0_65_46_12]PIR11642.1 MAG: NAD-glutamate dehydrogenase [Gammaproteobacteria bacterium CG11_big_fil_rev_8_21_14_0_20_46_22]